MATKKDIKDLLNDYNPTPPEGGWEAVQSRMTSESATDVKDVLSDYHARPAADQWGNINKRLIWNRFLTFRSGHFNVFYLAVVLLIFSGSLLIATRPSGDAVYTPRNSTLADATEFNSAEGNQAGALPQQSTALPVSTDNKRPAEQSASDKATSTPVKANNEYLAGTAGTPAGNELSVAKPGHGQQPEHLSPGSTERSSRALSTKKQENQNRWRKSLINMPLLSLFPIPDFGPERIQPPDTLAYDYQNKPILSEKPNFSVSLSYSGIYASTGYEASDNSNLSNENTDVIQRLNHQTQPLYSHSLALNFHYLQKHFVASAGIGITELHSVFSGDIPYTVVDSTEAFSYFENGNYVYDTTWYLNLDTLLITGDSVFSPYVDSSYDSFTDSTLVMEYDTTQAQKKVNQKHRLRYVNIPVWLGYRETAGIMEYQVQAGLIASIPVNNTYTWYNPETGNLVYNSEAPFRQTVFTLGVRGYFAVSLNEHWSAGLEPAYYYRLNSLFESDYAIHVNQHKFGVGLRVQYSF